MLIHLGGHVLAHDALVPLLTPIDDLRPHPDNPRNGDTDAIIDSLTTNGMYRPLYTTRDGVILAGNHTYAAALELGATTLPVIRLDVDTDQAHRIMLGDNKIADLGWYDDALLLDLLDRLTDTDQGLSGTGYTNDDTELLRLTQNPPAGYTANTGDLIIHGLPLDALTIFRDIPGTDDRERFLVLINEMFRDNREDEPECGEEPVDWFPAREHQEAH